MGGRDKYAATTAPEEKFLYLHFYNTYTTTCPQHPMLVIKAARIIKPELRPLIGNRWKKAKRLIIR